MSEAQPRKHSRTGLFVPFILVGLALAGWTVWWFWLATQVEQRLEAQAASLRQSGWTVTYSDLSTTGWPFRTRVEIRDISIAAPSTHALASAVLLAEANAYAPTRWVVLAPDGLTVTRAAKGRVVVQGDAIRASISGLTQSYPNIAVELANPVFSAQPGAEAFPISRAGRIEFYLRPHLGPAEETPVPADAATRLKPGPDSVDVLFRLIDGEGRAGGPVQGMARNGKLTAQIETVIDDASRLRGADSAGVFAAWTASGGRFLNTRGEIAAGDSRATLSSDILAADANGRLQGSIALKAERPLSALAGLARSGSPGINPVGAAGAAAASADPGPVGSGDAVDLTLVFRDGRTFLGPFALAPAPRLF